MTDKEIISRLYAIEIATKKIIEVNAELLDALKTLVEVIPQTYVHIPDQREAVKKAFEAIENAEKQKQ